MSEAVAGERVKCSLLEAEGLLRVEVDNPKGNILDAATMTALTSSLRAHREIASLRMVLLCAAGRHFSYGASVEEHRQGQAAGMLATFRALMIELTTYPVPIAALVQGKCLGGAFEVALCCHFVFTTEDAVFACPEIKLGVFPPALAVLGPLRLGHSLAERLLLTGAELAAEEALRAGFSASILRSEAPEAELLSWYRGQLAGRSGFSIRQATRSIRVGSGMIEAVTNKLQAAIDHYVEELLPSHDGCEGIEAFLLRRPPLWEHR